MSVTFLLNSLHSVDCLWAERTFTDSPMATGAFMTWGSFVDLQSSHFSCSPGLAGVEVELDSAKVLLE